MTLTVRDLRVFGCTVLLIGGVAHAAGESSSASAAQRCTALARQAGATLGEPTARIVTAKLNAPSAPTIDPKAPPWAATIPAMPEHCEVEGLLRERVGKDGQHYAVRYRMRLPTGWNGRFLFQGGGGTNGLVGTAIGTLQPGMPTALDQGYAVVSTDTGHDNATNSNPAKQGSVAFGHDYQARLEYSEKALDSVATTAKRIVQAFYGRAADRSYFAGCSNGGREGMVFAQRFPTQFDGIVAAAPAFAVPKAALAEAWDTQTFAALAAQEGFTRQDGLPDMTRAFTDADLDIVADTVAKVCDADDGVVDGMVQDVLSCTTARMRPALEARICADGKDATCLGRGQVEALVRSFSGPRNSKGEALYAGWPWDLGVGDMGWRVWKLGMPGAMDAINVTLGSPALSGLFVTPPAPVAATADASLRYQIEFDFDRDAQKIFGTSAEFPRSGWDLVGAQSTDLDAFRQHGGRLLVPHGGSDPIFSINDTVDWWRKVDVTNRGKAADVVRVFAVPGMTHCAGGPATDQYDALAAVVAWVENDRAPERIEAKAGATSPWPGRTRPLCAYPMVARYTSGDVNRAESFVCAAPSR
ncbi:tannase/feruloyl esterase family alpha/beta hydrolase [Povalibacter sp.]|uniref:tannase/feruloyl esterase family alpha/beta hydrolase n=1 Tax=Povalibacter sp. TaxID=1962978 RepID=UPI002F3F0B04